MDEDYPRFDALIAIQAKLSTFSSHCNDLLQESVCLLDEIAKFGDLVCIFTPLNSALAAFLLERPRCDAYLNEYHASASCYQEEGRSSNNAVRFGITKEEAEDEDPLTDKTIVPAMPKLRIRLRKPKAVRPQHFKVKKKKQNTTSRRPLMVRAASSKPKTANNEVAVESSSAHDASTGEFSRNKICGAPIQSNSDLQRHMHADKMFSCEACGYETKRKEHFQKHKMSAHCGLIFQCAVCGRVISRRSSFYIHLKSHTAGYTCHICRVRCRSSMRLQNHLRNHPKDGESFACDRCGYKTNKEGLHQRHAKFCWPDKAFKCAVCGVVKGLKKTLVEHIAICHPKDLIMCEICSKLLKSTIALNLHLQSHAAKRTLKCDECDYRTWRKSLLRVHQLTHGEKTLRCPHKDCAVVVKRRGALRSHIRRAHGDGARPYVCDHCEWTFHTPNGLKRHLQSHANLRPFPCLICGYPFSREANRGVHMRTVHKLDPSDPRLQPRLPAAYTSAADGDAPTNSADLGLAVQSDFPSNKIRHRRRRQPPFSNKKQSTSRVSVAATSKENGLAHRVTSADELAPIISTNQITEISANQVASIISANAVVTNPAANHLAFNPNLTLAESIPSTAAPPSCDVASFYNPQFLDYQFQPFSGQF